MAFLGCDMVYPSSGPSISTVADAPDPLREDPTLQSLEAKSARLRLIAAATGCAVVNLSAAPPADWSFPGVGHAAFAAGRVPRPRMFGACVDDPRARDGPRL